MMKLTGCMCREKKRESGYTIIEYNIDKMISIEDIVDWVDKTTRRLHKKEQRKANYCDQKQNKQH